MGKPIEITPELLADIEAKAEFVEPKIYRLNENYDIICDNPHLSGDTILIAKVEFGEDAEYIAAANPAVMLAMSKEIKRLWAAQCWVIAAIDTDKAAFGPFFEKNDAEYRMDSMPTEFAKKHKIRLCKGGE